MSTPVFLVDELKAFVEETVRNYVLETNQTDTVKAPQVVTGYLPPKSSTPEPDYPYVIVRLIDGTDDAGDATVTVRILAGTWSEDAQNGWRDPTNILQRIRTRLLQKRVIAKQFCLKRPLKFEMPEEQPFPEWVGAMTTVWTIPQPVEEINDEEAQ